MPENPPSFSYIRLIQNKMSFSEACYLIEYEEINREIGFSVQLGLVTDSFTCWNPGGQMHMKLPIRFLQRNLQLFAVAHLIKIRIGLSYLLKV